MRNKKKRALPNFEHHLSTRMEKKNGRKKLIYSICLYFFVCAGEFRTAQQIHGSARNIRNDGFVYFATLTRSFTNDKYSGSITDCGALISSIYLNTSSVSMRARITHEMAAMFSDIEIARHIGGGGKKSLPKENTTILKRIFRLAKLCSMAVNLSANNFCWYLSPSTRRSHLDSIIIPRYRLCFDNFMLPTVAIEAHVKFHHFIKFPGI